ncbi:MAG: PilZ domain-containing protein [Spirochaetia bacterium]
MQKRRKHPRHDTILYLQVYSLPDKAPIARMTDISAEGLMLLSSTTFTLNSPFEAVIAMPSGGILGESELKCTLTPRWEGKDENPDLVLTGCTMQVPEAYKSVLDELISRYSFSSGNTDFRKLFEKNMNNSSSQDK